MSLDYIRECYGVPAKRGMTIIAQGRKGTIVGARNAYLRVRLEGEKDVLSFHPTWEIEYPEIKEEVGR